MGGRRRSRKRRLLRLFPLLRANDFRITSRRTPQYNCIAWAANARLPDRRRLRFSCQDPPKGRSGVGA